MYKQKYLKYKAKYLKLRAQYEGTVFGPSNSDVEREEEFVESDENVVKDRTRYPESEGYDVVTTTDEGEARDIGREGLARGKPLMRADVSKDQFTKDVMSPDKDKILHIKKLDPFDDFTEKYGKLIKDQNLVLIRWDKVAKDFKGFYINPGLKEERFENAFFKGETYSSWWQNDFPFADGMVVMFVDDKQDNYKGEPIKAPFVGHKMRPAGLDDDEFATFFDKTEKKKIVKISTFDGFDEFTNKYGKLVDSKLHIRWDDVKEDYKGLIVDLNSDIVGTRDKKAMFKGDGITSWMINDKIKPGFVYTFN